MSFKNGLIITIVVIGTAFTLGMVFSNDFYVWVMARVYSLLTYVLVFIAGWLWGRFGDKLSGEK